MANVVPQNIVAAAALENAPLAPQQQQLLLQQVLQQQEQLLQQQATVQGLQEQLRETQVAVQLLTQRMHTLSTNTYRRMINTQKGRSAYAPLQWLQNDGGQEPQGVPPTRIDLYGLQGDGEPEPGAHALLDGLMDFYGLPQQAEGATIVEKVEVLLLHIGSTP